MAIETSSVPFWLDFLVIVSVAFLMIGSAAFLIEWSYESQIRFRQERDVAFVNKYRHDRNYLLYNSQFYKDNGYSWDFIIVLHSDYTSQTVDYFISSMNRHLQDNSKIISTFIQNELGQTNGNRIILRTLLSRLKWAGLDIYLMHSMKKDYIFIKIRAKLSRLMKEANRIRYTMPVYRETAKSTLEEGCPGKWDPVHYLDKYYDTKLDPFDSIYAVFSSNPLHWKFFHNPILNLQSDNISLNAGEGRHIDIELSEKHIFSDRDRLYLISSILQGRLSSGGAHIELQKLHKHRILSYYALHNTEELDVLEEKWLVAFAWPWDLPYGEIREYFGERIGLYFAMQSHLTKWLMAAAAMGVLAWLAVALNNNDPSSNVLPFYGALMAVWATGFLENWKRKESRIAMEWGMTYFEADEQSRPDYVGKSAKSPIDNSEIIWFEDSERYIRIVLSTIALSFALLLSLGTSLAIMFLRIRLMSRIDISVDGILMGNFIASLVNVFQIIIGNYFFGFVAKMLTDFENYRTETEYEDNLILKTFGFQYINSYATLFYIAFAKGNIGDLDHCSNYDCMLELKTTLGTLFVAKILINVLTSIVSPLLQQYIKKTKSLKGYEDVKNEVCEVEMEFLKTNYDEFLGTFHDYSADVLQFGYMSMFITAYPLAAVMLFVMNYVMIRINAWTLCHIYRRPLPRQAQDIGYWYFIYEFLGFSSVIVNSAIIAFTSTVAVKYKNETRVWIFIGIVVALLSIKAVQRFLIHDDPLEVKTQLRRQHFITSKIFENKSDDVSWRTTEDQGTDLCTGMESIGARDMKPF